MVSRLWPKEATPSSGWLPQRQGGCCPYSRDIREGWGLSAGQKAGLPSAGLLATGLSQKDVWFRVKPAGKVGRGFGENPSLIRWISWD